MKVKMLNVKCNMIINGWVLSEKPLVRSLKAYDI